MVVPFLELVNVGVVLPYNLSGGKEVLMVRLVVSLCFVGKVRVDDECVGGIVRLAERQAFGVILRDIGI